jgi:hypothetical protein
VLSTPCDQTRADKLSTVVSPADSYSLVSSLIFLFTQTTPQLVLLHPRRRSPPLHLRVLIPPTLSAIPANSRLDAAHLRVLVSPLPHLCYTTMSSDNCAIGHDGKLLDASEIEWFDDPDDDKPMASATTSSTAQRQRSTMTLDSFVTKGPLAARRSNRTVRPSTKLVDPNNAMGLKRKRSNTSLANPSRRLRQAPSEHEEDHTTEPDSTDTEAEVDDPVDPDAAYEETKALGDADRAVCVHLPPPRSLSDALQRPCSKSPRRSALLISEPSLQKPWSTSIRTQERSLPGTTALSAGMFSFPHLNVW